MVDTEVHKSTNLSKSEIYKIALDTRNMEIELFWKRSNYFLVLNTAVAAGFFLKATNEHQLILGVFGLIISILWFLVSSGSKFWQSRWERRLHIVEESLNPEIKLFSSDWKEINQDVSESIEFSKHPYIRRCLDKVVLKKPSVSYMMQLLSIVFILLWAILILVELLSNKTSNEFGEKIMFGNLFQFLNENSGALTVVFTAVVTLSTVVYALLTAVLVSETKKMREVQTEPKIEITLRPLESAINIISLHIKNIGLGPAGKLEFTTSVVSGGEGAENLLAEFTETNFFKTGIRYLGPGQERYSHYTQMTQNYDQKIQSILLFKIKYKSITGKKYSEKITIDLSEMKGNHQLGKPNLYAIAQSLEKMQKDMGHIVSGFKRIRTDIYTQEDREREYQERMKQFEEMEADKKDS